MQSSRSLSAKDGRVGRSIANSLLVRFRCILRMWEENFSVIGELIQQENSNANMELKFILHSFANTQNIKYKSDYISVVHTFKQYRSWLLLSLLLLLLLLLLLFRSTYYARRPTTFSTFSLSGIISKFKSLSYISLSTNK
jgi:hypothetical protein